MIGELSAVVGELGGEAAIGRIVRSDEDLRAAIRDGLPHAAVEGLLQSTDLSLRELAATLDLSVRSLQRRKREGRLARFESDRIYRLARILALAEHFLGERSRATAWLKRPNQALGGVPPLQAIDTELGARTVENVLGRIGYGGIS
jgi:putative toxin-antitoxin system antitoxin component (TIGR02293 family)